MRTLLRFCKGILSIVAFAGNLVRFVVYIAFAIDIGVLFICGFGYFIAFLIPIAIVWAIPVVAGGLITKCDESIQESKENAYYEKMYGGKSNSYQGTRHESHYENYYDNMGYRRRDPDTYKITNGRNTADSATTATNRRVNYTPRPDSCKELYEEVHAAK